ncbi:MULTISPECIES: asparagine synthase (glutamine-hydrolyzing) [Yersinia]|uniref:asparagine synthase (glutamine-hydrolyzing) n=1 Tax=Yersinia TaxID=629 RepID=UPI0005DF3EBE|nr:MULTISPECIES: asparagine synthase (glutamine-hydrolyzing) [Yersinia]MBW5818871.1 asparagine synthase (glutamine-hydrolyzing) [Yersinia kristensenii]MBW5844487.1 asparagine synthase (glutamine-hydrolyzing) [Yersinia kristensenii]MDA5491624.1 asparagine synthase (glutamine-hydrolyzing) [Yersinia kristensenii]CNG00539.1 asparagine synthetase B [Yersinia frederiksenii]
MCGFICEYKFSGKVQVSKVITALKSLQHRGPDESNVWVSTSNNVSFGHSRLSIIGLKSGLQPLLNNDDTLVTVVNGEFYDYKEIAREFPLHKFKTESDSELILPIYEQLGISGFRKLRGEFAFVIWDEKNKKIVSGRDRFGVKPLYYTITDDSVILASEIKAIIALGVKPIWNPSAIHGSERMLYPNTKSCFKNIYQVPPGHVLTVSENEGVSITPYWEKSASSISENLDDSQLISTFRDKFDNAVETRLKADVKIACYLSGGIDSCAVLGTSQYITGTAPESFTIAFDDDNYSELERAKLQANYVNSHLNVLEVSEQDIVNNYERAIHSFEVPFGNTHGIAKVLLSEEVRKHGVKVVLTGEGADEVLAGYPHIREDMFRFERGSLSEHEGLRYLKEMYNDYSKFPGFLIQGNVEKDLDAFGAIWGYVPGMLRTGSQRGSIFSTLYRNKYLSYHHMAKPYSDILTHVEWLKNRDYDIVHRSLDLWQNTVLPSYILTVLGDRAEMANSVEGRVPFLDHHLFEYLMNVPTRLKISGKIEKFILREAMRERVHPDILSQTKMPFMSPPAKITKNSSPLREYMGDIFNTKYLDEQPFYSPMKTRKLFDSVNSMPVSQRLETDRILTFILSVCVMQKVFGFSTDGEF